MQLNPSQNFLPNEWEIAAKSILNFLLKKVVPTHRHQITKRFKWIQTVLQKLETVTVSRSSDIFEIFQMYFFNLYSTLVHKNYAVEILLTFQSSHIKNKANPVERLSDKSNWKQWKSFYQRNCSWFLVFLLLKLFFSLLSVYVILGNDLDISMFLGFLHKEGLLQTGDYAVITHAGHNFLKAKMNLFGKLLESWQNRIHFLIDTHDMRWDSND